MVPINLLAVVVSAVVVFALGWLWYSVLFGKPWMAMMGITPERMAQMGREGKNKMMMGYGIQFVGALIMAFVLAHAVLFANTYLQMSGAVAGGFVGLMNWIGFVAPTTVGMVLWEGKPWKLWMIVSGYWLVSLIIMGIILSLWG
jgi:hypothetical protein